MSLVGTFAQGKGVMSLVGTFAHCSFMVVVIVSCYFWCLSQGILLKSVKWVSESTKMTRATCDIKFFRIIHQYSKCLSAVFLQVFGIHDCGDEM